MRLRVYPGFLPGVAVSILLAFWMSGPLGRVIGVSKPVAWGLIVGVGIAISATLTPGGDAIRWGVPGSGTCDLSRLGLVPIYELVQLTESGLNVLLFIPLGIAVGLVRRSPTKLLLIAAAVALPFAIEAIQFVLTPLDRKCQSADAIDNLTGLALGLGCGAIVGAIAGAVHRSSRMGSRPDDHQRSP